jgi:hypothetical protein
MNRYEELINDMNRIIGFLDLSDEAIFESVKRNDRYSLGLTIGSMYDDNYDEYRNHICMSGFLLGFSFIEGYLYDILKLILTKKPEINKHKVTIKYILDNNHNLYEKVADDYIRNIGFTEMLKELNKELRIFQQEENNELMVGYNIRNCIMHNSGIADSRLEPKYKNGARIELNSGDVNSFGLMARSLVRKIWDLYLEWDTQDHKKNGS